ncbi:MAG: hypothetical protein QOI03_1596 [Solirubrobacteraceae bacterium]|jgi:hypothetical protein|nr:hypothetical protein [Solirubrobacteraceae bacterium]
MYHLELRQFPHNLCRFNLTDAQLRVVVEPWVREQVIEMGERKWSPQQAKITIIEGSQLAMAELSMGRGWRAAQRRGEDVTERVLAAARVAAAASASGQLARPAGAGADPLGVGVALAAVLGSDAERLLAAWRSAASEHPSLTPSESLALAERTIGVSAGDPS